MLTRNFYALLACNVLGNTAENTGVTYQTGLKSAPSSPNYSSYKSDGVALYNPNGGSSWSPLINQLKPQDNSKGGVIFGDGNTPATLDDYALSGAEITTLEATNVVTVNSTKYEYVQVTSTFTLTNTGDSEVVIREVGLISHCWSLGSTWGVLVERTVLDLPVAIPAGGVGQVEYSVRMELT